MASFEQRMRQRLALKLTERREHMNGAFTYEELGVVCSTSYEDVERKRQVLSNVLLFSVKDYDVSRKGYTYCSMNGYYLWFYYFHYACITGHVKVVRCLIEYGVKFDITCIQDDMTVLMCVCDKNTKRKKRKKILRMILNEKGGVATINDSNRVGMTALHFAAQFSNTNYDSVVMLLEYGANIHLGDLNGCVVLHYAQSGDSYEIVKLLLKWGADITLLDNDGDSVLSRAREFSGERMVELLSNAEDLFNSITEWRPHNSSRFPNGYRVAMKTLLLLARVE